MADRIASSTLAAPSIDLLSARLMRNLADENRLHDPFAPARVLVANRQVQQWLKLKLATSAQALPGIVANVRFEFARPVLTERLAAIAGMEAGASMGPAELQPLITNVLRDCAKDPALAPFARYIGKPSEPEYWRRLLELSSRLAAILHSYENHRNEWIADWLGLTSLDPGPPLTAINSSIFSAQRQLFARLLALRTEDQVFFTELASAADKLLQKQNSLPNEATRPLHVFGITHLSRLELSVLSMLARYETMVFYSVVRPPVHEESGAPSVAVAWAGPECEKTALLGQVKPALKTESLKGGSDSKEGSSVLARLQSRLTQGKAKRGAVKQDRSIQIAGCPGKRREIETVFHSILRNLSEDETLELSDIAVLVPNMSAYYPVLESVFRGGCKAGDAKLHLPFNLSDFSAHEVSHYARGISAILDMIQYGMSRARLFQLLLNRCCREALGVAHEDVVRWLDWASELNVWEEPISTKGAIAYGAVYTPEHGLKRLRLGAIMETPGPSDERHFQDLVPYQPRFEDPSTGSIFSLAVHELRAAARRLSAEMTADAMATELERLFASFLRVPDELSGENEVRYQVDAALREMHGMQITNATSLFARSQIQAHLEGIEAGRGKYLAGGITVAGLRPHRPIPFRILYLVGMTEGDFPGQAQRTTLDLCNEAPRVAHPSSADENRQAFLDALLAAQDKLYITYTNEDTVADRRFHPCSTVAELVTLLGQELSEPFQIASLPLHLWSAAMAAPKAPSWSDLYWLASWDHSVELLRMLGDRAQLDASTQERFQNLQSPNSNGTPEEDDSARMAHEDHGGLPRAIRIQDLAKFLEFPVDRQLQTRAALYDDDSSLLELDGHSPFFIEPPDFYFVQAEILKEYVRRSIAGEVTPSLEALIEQTERRLRAGGRRGDFPSGPFAEIDRPAFTERFRDIYKPELQTLLASGGFQAGAALGPAGLGYQAFPPAKFDLILSDGSKHKVEISGQLPFVSFSDGTLRAISVRAASAASDRHFLHAFVFYLALIVSCKQAGATPPSLCEVTVFPRKKESTRAWSVSTEEAEEYLERAARDLLLGPLDFLPLGLVTHADLTDLQPWGMAPGAIDEARARVYVEQLRITEQEEEGSFRDSDVASLVASNFPESSIMTVRDRFALFFATKKK